MSKLIKICGLVKKDQVEAAINADYVGFVIGSPKSRRNLHLTSFHELSQIYPEKTVAVTSTNSENYLKLIDRNFECIIQLHGKGRQFVDKLVNPKAMALSIEEIRENRFSNFYDQLNYLVVDSSHNQYGGTGETWEWEKVSDLTIPILIAGGISISNLVEALDKTKAQGVDISSGVEINGKKSIPLINQTIRKVKSL